MFLEKCLNEHNLQRSLHEDTRPLEWDDELEMEAWFFAEKLKQRGKYKSITDDDRDLWNKDKGWGGLSWFQVLGIFVSCSSYTCLVSWTSHSGKFLLSKFLWHHCQNLDNLAKTWYNWYNRNNFNLSVYINCYFWKKYEIPQRWGLITRNIISKKTSNLLKCFK